MSDPSRGPGAMSLSPLAATLAMAAAATLVRVGLLFVTPLQLYPDEAQYWRWSHHLAFGYFSKPPMVAWLIAATRALGGDGEPWVRLAAPLLHGVAAVAVGRAGARLYDERTGLLAAALYLLMPGVQLSSTVIATDAPLLMFLALATWAYAALWRAPEERGWLAAWCLGVALGLACLSKYAGLYFVLGLGLHAVADPRARVLWRGGWLLLAMAILALMIAPNLAWNAAHGWRTLAHTADDARWGEPRAGGLAGLWVPVTFILSQFGVFGAVPFAVLAGGTVVLGCRRRLRPADALLLALAAPAFGLVLAEATLARANANWAAAAFPPAVVLASALLLRRRRRGAVPLALALNGLIAALYLVAMASPLLADRTGPLMVNSFKRARGWREEAALVRDAAAHAGPVTAVTVDGRFDFDALGYYGRDWLGAPGAPPLRAWVRSASPRNDAEASAPLTTADGGRVLALSSVAAFRGEMRADFAGTTPAPPLSVRLDRKHVRTLAAFVGQGFRPRPRDARTGLPPRP